MTNPEAKAIIEANAVPAFPLQIEYQDWLTAIHMAEEALDKRIPKKPIKSDREIRYCEVWKCPSCGFEWSSRVVDFCYKCGQAIDWSEED